MFCDSLFIEDGGTSEETKKNLICVESYSRELEVISIDRLVNTENEKRVLLPSARRFSPEGENECSQMSISTIC